MLDAIPAELRALEQWVITNARDPADDDYKRPVNARNGEWADVQKASTWSSFNVAKNALSERNPLIGFVLTRNDPFCIIDLDPPQNDEQAARHRKIIDAFSGTYQELSQSRNGVHIVCRGTTPRGVRRDHVEIYSAERYLIFTGERLNQQPVTDQQSLIDLLFNEMAREQTELSNYVDGEQTETDEQIYQRAAAAKNADKFLALWRGEWRGAFPSQSEADFSLLSMLAFYTRNTAQIIRLFRASALGQRKKAQRDRYITDAIARIRANETPPIDISELLATAPAVMAVQSIPSTPAHEFPDNDYGVSEMAGDITESIAPRSIAPPPGFVGELANYIYATATRPSPAVALAAAIALTAGICGRAYNVSGTGLNQYIILCGQTGVGKEGAASGIDALLGALRPRVPMVDQFVGPSRIASGPGLIRTLDKKPCCLVQMGEIGLTLQQISSARANNHEKDIRRVLLDIYNKSGRGKMLQSSAYSDSDKNTNPIKAPALTILGDTTPQELYDSLDESHVASGLLPRFSIIEAGNARPARNKKAFFPPPPEIIDKLAYLVTQSIAMQQNNAVCDVQFSSDALPLLDQFDEEADARMRLSDSDVALQTWNRAHLKALKLAALIAVGCDPNAPVIDAQAATWAIDFVRDDIRNLCGRFEAGAVGEHGARQDYELLRIVDDYLHLSRQQRYRVQVPEKALDAPVIPYSYVRNRARKLRVFQIDRRGLQRALQEGLADLTHAGILVKLDAAQALAQFGVRGLLFAPGEAYQARLPAKHAGRPGR